MTDLNINGKTKRRIMKPKHEDKKLKVYRVLWIQFAFIKKGHEAWSDIKGKSFLGTRSPRPRKVKPEGE